MCTALSAMALACAVAPPDSIAAASQNATATHAYLTAMNIFVEAELASQAQDIATTEATAARVSGECPGVLTGAPPHEEASKVRIVSVPSQLAPSARAQGERSRQSRQLEDLKLELAFALDGRTQPEREAAAALVHTLSLLTWSNPRITFLVHLTGEILQEELDLPAAPVCADMRAWVASGYRTLSPVSKEVASHSEALLKRSFELIGLATQTSIQPLSESLLPYENASDEALAHHTQALTEQLRKGDETEATARRGMEETVGLPTSRSEARAAEKRPTRKPVVIARGRTAAGGRFVAKAEPSSHPGFGCAVFVTITEASRPSVGLLGLLSGEGTGRCLSRSHVEPEPAVHCNSGRLTVEADLPPAARSVRLMLSDGATITTPAILVPARLGGPVGLYYQVVRGPSPIPVSLTELDAQGNTLTTLKLPAVVECTKHPVKYFPGGIVQLVRESPPQIPAFTIRGERYRKLGAVHFELKLEVSNEGSLFGGGGESFIPEGELIPGESERARRMFTPRASSGCLPQPYAIVYGVLRARGDTVLARVSGELVPLREVPIPAHLHAGGVLVYGAFSPLPTELLLRDAHGTTIGREDLAQNADSVTETCEGEAE
jgi:hypothetical protein